MERYLDIDPHALGMLSGLTGRIFRNQGPAVADYVTSLTLEILNRYGCDQEEFTKCILANSRSHNPPFMAGLQHGLTFGDSQLEAIVAPPDPTAMNTEETWTIPGGC